MAEPYGCTEHVGWGTICEINLLYNYADLLSGHYLCGQSLYEGTFEGEPRLPFSDCDLLYA